MGSRLCVSETILDDFDHHPIPSKHALSHPTHLTSDDARSNLGFAELAAQLIFEPVPSGPPKCSGPVLSGFPVCFELVASGLPVCSELVPSSLLECPEPVLFGLPVCSELVP